MRGGEYTRKVAMLQVEQRYQLAAVAHRKTEQRFGLLLGAVWIGGEAPQRVGVAGDHRLAGVAGVVEHGHRQARLDAFVHVQGDRQPRLVHDCLGSQTRLRALGQQQAATLCTGMLNQQLQHRREQPVQLEFLGERMRCLQYGEDVELVWESGQRRFMVLGGRRRTGRIEQRGSLGAGSPASIAGSRAANVSRRLLVLAKLVCVLARQFASDRFDMDELVLVGGVNRLVIAPSRLLSEACDSGALCRYQEGPAGEHRGTARRPSVKRGLELLERRRRSLSLLGIGARV